MTSNTEFKENSNFHSNNKSDNHQAKDIFKAIISLMITLRIGSKY